MDGAYLIVLDFDGNIADTFQPSPKGIGVSEAYRMAVKDIFGNKGLEIYERAGGLKNQAPEEIVKSLFISNSDLLHQAEKCFDQRNKSIRRLVPEGKGAPLEWAAGDQRRLQRTITEMLVLVKLSYLIDDIGSLSSGGDVWPQPCLGFLDFYDIIDQIRKEGLNIQTAIISSGHDEFIKRTFAVWGIEPPRIILTDDDMRARSYPVDFSRRIKPSSFLIDIVQAQWISGNLFSEYARHIELILNTRKRIMYFGDDSKKDGGLAKNAGIPFGHFKPLQKISFETEDLYFSFRNWQEFGDFLNQRRIRDLFKQKKSFAEIISHID